MKKRRTIVWRQAIPDIPLGSLTDLVPGRMEAMIESDSMLPSIPPIRRPSVPYVEENTSPKEELIDLLQLAAEVEHSLLVQYLYAAYSLANASSVLRKRLIEIAVQEMGHFLCVQNLLLAVGGIGSIHLHKDELRPSSTFNPLPFSLEPVSLEVLAKFTVVESPNPPPANVATELKAIEAIALASAGVQINPVGGLYQKIFWLLQANDNPDPRMYLAPSVDFPAGRHLLDADFLPVNELKQWSATRASWNNAQSLDQKSVITKAVVTRQEALDIVFEIADQGEGADFKLANSHFENFLMEYRNFSTQLPGLIYKVENPITVPNSEYKRSTMIEYVYALSWVQLHNCIYLSLVYDIHSSLFLKKGYSALAAEFIDFVFNGMRSSFPRLCTICFKLPRTGNVFFYDQDPRSGPTFELGRDLTLPSTLEDLVTTQTGCNAQVKVLLAKIRSDAAYEQHRNTDNEVFGLLNDLQDYLLAKEELLKTIA